jgi:hypothetical protein
MYEVGSLRFTRAPQERKFTSAKRGNRSELACPLPIGQVSNGAENNPNYPCKLRERLKLICCRNVSLHWSAITINNRDPLQSIFAVADVEVYMIRRLCILGRYECNSMHR